MSEFFLLDILPSECHLIHIKLENEVDMPISYNKAGDGKIGWFRLSKFSFGTQLTPFHIFFHTKWDF